jgi:hypothetical protein
MRNDLPLGIIDDEIPQDVYHHTLNPNPSTDQQSRTEEGAEEQPEQDSGIMDIDTEEMEKEEPSENRYNLRKRKSTSYKEVKDYKPRSNSRTDKKSKEDDSAKKSRTEESFEKHINRINSLRMENGLSYTEKRRLEHLICKSDIGYELTSSEKEDIFHLEKKQFRKEFSSEIIDD